MELTLRQVGVLGFLAQAPKPVSVREIASGLDISKPAVTRNIQKLCLLSLALSAPSKTDRRLIEIKITADGKAFLKAMDKNLTKPLPAEKPVVKAVAKAA